MALEGVDDRRGGQTLMDEKRKRGNVEREAFCLACPVEERLAHRRELVYRVLQPANSCPCCVVVELQLARGVEHMRRRQLGGVLDASQQKIREIPGAILSVPLQRGRQRRVIAVGDGRLLLLELRLRSDLGAQRAVSLRVAIALRFGLFFLGRFARSSTLRHITLF